MISLINAREVISTSGKEIILLVISQKAVGLGKGTTFQDQLEAKLLWETQTQSYPDEKLPRIVNLHDSSANLSQSRIESKAELNHHGDVRTSHTAIKAIQSISKHEPFHCRLLKTLKGVLLTL